MVFQRSASHWMTVISTAIKRFQISWVMIDCQHQVGAVIGLQNKDFMDLHLPL